MLPYEDTTSLSRLFHLNSEPWLNLDAYTEEHYEVEYRRLASADAAVALPPPDRSSPLDRLLARRRSCRAFSPEPLAIADLSTLLQATYGPARSDLLPTGLRVQSRVVPSAGGLYPLELYLLLTRVDGVAGGVYHLDLLHHRLEPMRGPASDDQLDEMILVSPFLENANVVVFVAGVFGRTLRKYGPRGYRYVLLEAGHAAQNFCLAAAELGLGSLCVGGYLDGRLNRFLQLDEPREGVVYAFAAGRPAAKDASEKPGGVARL